MIGIKFIDSSNMKTFAERLEAFINEHPDAKILFGQVKGIEGGKGVFCILSYNKKEKPKPKPLPKPIPKPKKPKKTPEELEIIKLKEQVAELEALKEAEIVETSAE